MEVFPFKIPVEKIPEIKPGAEYFLNIDFVLKDDHLWAKLGYSIASEQFELPWKKTAEVSEHKITSTCYNKVK